MYTNVVALCIVASVATATSLQQVIVLSRHGVRGPFGLGSDNPTQDEIDMYVNNPNIQLPLSASAWGTESTSDTTETVTPKLTKHGKQLIEQMGQYFRNYLYRELIDASNCNETIAYADANERDNLTAQSFFQGLYPDCKNLPITSQTKLLFEQGQDPTLTCPVTSMLEYEGITGTNGTAYIVEDIHEEIQSLNDELQCCKSSVCQGSSDTDQRSTENQCTLFDIQQKWNGTFYMPWEDTLSHAAYFSEWLTLQYVNNMTMPDGFTANTVRSIAKIHEAQMNLITNQVNSASFGATLIAHITASLEQTVRKAPLTLPDDQDGPKLVQSFNNRFLYYAAHDINQLYVRNLLRIGWFANGWLPHQPTPGGMIVLELHKSATTNPNTDQPLVKSAYYIKAFFVTASPDQMRNGEDLTDDNPPDRVPITIPFCTEEVWDPTTNSNDLRCNFSAFKLLVARTLKHECVAGTLSPFIDSLALKPEDQILTDGASTSGDDGTDTSLEKTEAMTAEVVVWAIFATLAVAVITLGVRRMQHRKPTLHRRRTNSSLYGSLNRNRSFASQRDEGREPLLPSYRERDYL